MHEGQSVAQETGVSTQPVSSTTLVPIRETARTIKAPERYVPIFAFAEEGESQSFDETVSGRLKDEWQEAMREEMDTLEQNATYELVELPAGRKALKNKWVYKLKQNPSRLPRYKARLL